MKKKNFSVIKVLFEEGMVRSEPVGVSSSSGNNDPAGYFKELGPRVQQKATEGVAAQGRKRQTCILQVGFWLQQ